MKPSPFTDDTPAFVPPQNADDMERLTMSIYLYDLVDEFELHRSLLIQVWHYFKTTGTIPTELFRKINDVCKAKDESE